MSKKIMVLCSSPHPHGNTNTVVDWVIEGAKEAGAEVERIDLTTLHYQNHGCIACMGCQQSERYECVVQDDAQPILARIPEADVLVLATPCYCGGPTAQLKVFFDRTFSLFKFNPNTGEVRTALKGKKMALVATAGGGLKEGLGLTENAIKCTAEFAGTKLQSLLVPNAPFEPGKINTDTTLRENAQAFGRGL